ncbi:hypothetical protein Pmar_PMAR004210, partial [Perkinsus marinus ATCC 50983]
SKLRRNECIIVRIMRDCIILTSTPESHSLGQITMAEPDWLSTMGQNNSNHI